MNNVHYINTAQEFWSQGQSQQLFEADKIHPNLRGTALLASAIRNSLQFNHKPLRHFVSKHAKPSELSYANSVKVRPPLSHQSASPDAQKSADESTTSALRLQEETLHHQCRPPERAVSDIGLYIQHSGW